MPPRAGRTDTGLVHASGWPLPRRLPRAARALRDPRDGAHTGAVRAGHRDAGRSARRGCRALSRRADPGRRRRCPALRFLGGNPFTGRLRAFGAPAYASRFRGVVCDRRSAHPLLHRQSGAPIACRAGMRRGERRLACLPCRCVDTDRRGPRDTREPRPGDVPCPVRCRGGAFAGDRGTGPRPTWTYLQSWPRGPPGYRSGHTASRRRVGARGDRRVTTGVVLMTYGAPRDPSDVPAYLTRVRGGRVPSAELATEMTRRYRIIGGSRLVAITETQAAALQRELGEGYLVRAAMRFSEPTIERVVHELALRVDQLGGIVLSAQR